jgi:hypothetical protein
VLSLISVFPADHRREFAPVLYTILKSDALALWYEAACALAGIEEAAYDEALSILAKVMKTAVGDDRKYDVAIIIARFGIDQENKARMERAKKIVLPVLQEMILAEQRVAEARPLLEKYEVGSGPPEMPSMDMLGL